MLPIPQNDLTRFTKLYYNAQSLELSMPITGNDSGIF